MMGGKEVIWTKKDLYLGLMRLSSRLQVQVVDIIEPQIIRAIVEVRVLEETAAATEDVEVMVTEEVEVIVMRVTKVGILMVRVLVDRSNSHLFNVDQLKRGGKERKLLSKKIPIQRQQRCLGRVLKRERRKKVTLKRSKQFRPNKLA